MIKSIAVSETTHAALVEFRLKDETMDEAIVRMMARIKLQEKIIANWEKLKA